MKDKEFLEFISELWEKKKLDELDDIIDEFDMVEQSEFLESVVDSEYLNISLMLHLLSIFEKTVAENRERLENTMIKVMEIKRKLKKGI